jgi:GNAT superfamily N-acetyltransferase
MEHSESTTPIPPALAATPQSHPQLEPITITTPAPSLADNDAITSRLTTLINTVYTTTESGLFGPTYARTSPLEVRKFLLAGELALAYFPSSLSISGPASLPSPSAESIIGVIRITSHAPAGEFGLFAVDPLHQGTGVGRSLIRFAEEECKKKGMEKMQCELLVPVGWEHPFKKRLQAWYERMGYAVVRREEFGREFFELAEHLVTEAELVVFEKGL